MNFLPVKPLIVGAREINGILPLSGFGLLYAGGIGRGPGGIARDVDQRAVLISEKLLNGSVEICFEILLPLSPRED